MADEEPLGIAEVLGAEFEALRPGGGYTGATDTAALFRKVHGDARPLSALCISGGGIRSATFALGALQELAGRRVLEQFDYLSTVSGGGYVGSWLTAWSNRVGGLQNVIPHLQPDAKPAEPGSPDPIEHLRDYNSYLSPKLGALSADTWTLAATILRNILLNWMVLIPLLMAAMMLPRLFLSILVIPELLFGNVIFGAGAPNYGATELDAISTSPVVHYFLPYLSALLFVAALFNTLRYLPGIGNEDHTRADYVFKVLLPLVASVLVWISRSTRSTTWEVPTPSKPVCGTRSTEGCCPALWHGSRISLFCKHPLRTRLRSLPLSLAIFAMAAGTGAAGWATVNFLVWSPESRPDLSWPAFCYPGAPAMVLGYVLGTVVFVGLSSRFLQDEDREWMSRNVAGMLMFCALWTLVCGAVLIAPRWAFEWETWAGKAVAAAGALGAWASAFGSALLARNAPRGATKPGKAWTAASMVIRAAPAVFILALAIGLSVATDILLTAVRLLPGVGKLPAMQVLVVDGAPVRWQDHYGVLARTSPALAAAIFTALLAISWVMARYININTFSLHGMYRDRLIRAYLGASNPSAMRTGSRASHAATIFRCTSWTCDSNRCMSSTSR